jgi:hypothetical protein
VSSGHWFRYNIELKNGVIYEIGRMYKGEFVAFFERLEEDSELASPVRAGTAKD